MQNQSSLNFVFINGRNGAGKDTQANILLEGLPNTIKISTGDVYRDARDGQGKYGKYKEQIAPWVTHVESGGLIPDEVILPIVGEIIGTEFENGIRNFIFTGFPRTIPQLGNLDRYLDDLSQKYDVKTRFIALAVLENTSRARAENRYREALASGQIPRADDVPEVVERRFSTYQNLIGPMLHKLADEKRLIVIKSNGGIEDVRARLHKEIAEGKSTNRELWHNSSKERE